MFGRYNESVRMVLAFVSAIALAVSTFMTFVSAKDRDKLHREIVELKGEVLRCPCHQSAKPHPASSGTRP
jgi:hypothetical protein